MVEKNNMKDNPPTYLADHINHIYHYNYIARIVDRAVLADCMANTQDALAKIILQQARIVEKVSRKSDLTTIINKLEIITLSLDKLMQTVNVLKYCIPSHEDDVKCSKAYCLLAGIFRPIAKYLETINPAELSKLDNLIIALGYLSLPYVLKDLDDIFENTIKNEAANTMARLESLHKKLKKEKNEHKKIKYESSYIREITYSPVHIFQTASKEVEKYVKRLLDIFYRM